MLYSVILVIQLAVTVVMGICFYRQLKQQPAAEPARPNAPRARKELDRLHAMRETQLSRPLNERVRPNTFEEIIGQSEGIRALKAILCGENPQHAIIYGPPGIGKTCAARLVLEAAKESAGTPFAQDAPFIEVDATCVRFDERSIADQLIGSVHDPIYQGAGQLGINGVPQPKEGAVTRAHGGVLFLDEIGELHPLQMNKLLKVLEDRVVRFESAYYNPDDTQTPRHIHEIFERGLPADFRLVAATTRSPEDISPALRSRCMEVFFRPLDPAELARIAAGAAIKAGAVVDSSDAELIGRYAGSGRGAVSIVQMAVGVAHADGRESVDRSDIEWVLDVGHYSPRHDVTRRRDAQLGLVNGLAVHGAHQGAVMEIEAVAAPGTGKLSVTGIVEQEDMGDGRGHTMRRTSTAKAALLNALTRLRHMGVDVDAYDIHVNFPGGMPVDGPSAGIAMAVACYSAIVRAPISPDIAITGEISVNGRALPVGGVPAKIEAALKAGLKRVLIPAANDQDRYRSMGIEIIPIETLDEALTHALSGSVRTDTAAAVPAHGPLAANEIARAAESCHNAPSLKSRDVGHG